MPFDGEGPHLAVHEVAAGVLDVEVVAGLTGGGQRGADGIEQGWLVALDGEHVVAVTAVDVGGSVGLGVCASPVTTVLVRSTGSSSWGTWVTSMVVSGMRTWAMTTACSCSIAETASRSGGGHHGLSFV